MIEIWKDIPGYENIYQVSSKGNVRSKKYGYFKYLKPCIRNGYRKVALYKAGQRKDFNIGRLVLMSFVQNIDHAKMQVNHKNCIKTQDTLDNLEWVTPKENIEHAYNNGVNKNYGETHGRAKINKEDYWQIVKMYNNDISVNTIAKQYKVHCSSIYGVFRKGILWLFLVYFKLGIVPNRVI